MSAEQDANHDGRKTMNRAARRPFVMWALPAAVCLAIGFGAGGSWALERRAQATSQAAVEVVPPPPGHLEPLRFPGLDHILRFSENLYNGSVPEGDEGFATLRRLGIRTVISVDGQKPDVERARRYGLRYVHLPFGYDGCPRPTATRIVRAVRDLPGPIYVHCHHGKNRSPVATAVARIALDGISNEEGVAELERAGAGKNYAGLYEDIRSFRPPTAAELEAAPADFPEISPTPAPTEAMVEIQHRFDALLDAQRNGWSTSEAAPEAHPAHQALLLREQYTELLRTEEFRKYPRELRQGLREAERQGKDLEAALRRGDRDRATMMLGTIAAGCGSCHARYRNVSQR
jgi:protein tyrosine phosphatase (PTP) superfamily phosphohydrolase (DUF442 family)